MEFIALTILELSAIYLVGPITLLSRLSLLLSTLSALSFYSAHKSRFPGTLPALLLTYFWSTGCEGLVRVFKGQGLNDNDCMELLLIVSAVLILGFNIIQLPENRYFNLFSKIGFYRLMLNPAFLALDQMQKLLLFFGLMLLRRVIEYRQLSNMVMGIIQSLVMWTAIGRVQGEQQLLKLITFGVYFFYKIESQVKSLRFLKSV